MVGCGIGEAVTAIAWGASTHKGHVRKINEDNFVAEPPVFMVADGMGGHDRGEVASGLVAERFRRLADATELDHDTVVEALRLAHRNIRERRDPSGSEMGTTMAAMVLVPGPSSPHWLMVNVGDSRVYRLADGRLEQLSVDHSVVQELIEAGRLTPEGANTHPERHVITRAVGVGSDIVADYAVREPEAGERYLLCSDGVHGQLTVAEIRDALVDHADPQDAAASLVASVLAGRAPDNLTVVVVDVVAETGEPPDHVDEDTSPRRLIDVVSGEFAAPDAPDAAGESESESGDDGPGLIEVPTW